ncbi:hypothetical protein D9M69_09510 [compost metagenome]
MAGGGGQVWQVWRLRGSADINESGVGLAAVAGKTENAGSGPVRPGPRYGDESGWEPGGIRRCADPAGRDRARGALRQDVGRGDRKRVRAAGPHQADRRIGHRRQAISHGHAECLIRGSGWFSEQASRVSRCSLHRSLAALPPGPVHRSGAITGIAIVAQRRACAPHPLAACPASCAPAWHSQAAPAAACCRFCRMPHSLAGWWW